MIAGPNGAGKSTVAPALLRDLLGVAEFVNADQIAVGLSAFNPGATAFRAGRLMLQRVHDLASRKRDFAFESTLASRSFQPFLRDLGQSGYRVFLVYLWLRSATLARARVAQRVRSGGHDVPAAVVRRRYGRSLANFFGLYQNLADEWRFYDNSLSFDARLIAVGGRDRATEVREDVAWKAVLRSVARNA